MKKLAETNPTLKQLENLVATKRALFMKAGIFKLHYNFTVPTTRVHPPPSPIRRKVQQPPNNNNNNWPSKLFPSIKVTAGISIGDTCSCH